MTNNNLNDFQNRLFSRNSSRLTISEQIDLLYSENNNLKTYINQLTMEKDDTIKKYEEKIGHLEYNQIIVTQDLSNSSNLIESRINHFKDEILRYKNIINEKLYENKSLIEDYKKLEERYRVANEYINLLPTPHESDRLNKNLNRLKTENDRYKYKYQESETVIRRLETEMTEKNAELANLCDKEVIMKSQMDLLGEKLSRVKCTPLIKEENVCNWNFTPDLYEDLKLTVEKYKSELNNCKQLLEADKSKYSRNICSYQKKIDELQMQLECEAETITALRKEIENKQLFCNDLERNLKSIINQKQNIMGNMMDLQNEIQKIHNFGSDEVQQLYNRLLREVLACVRDTETLARCLYKLINKEDIDISMLINCSEFDNLTIEDSESQLLEKNYLKDQLECIKQARTRIFELKNSLLQYHTDSMASDVKFCLTQ